MLGGTKVAAYIELVTYADLETAWNRMAKVDVKYRFVLDGASIADPART